MYIYWLISSLVVLSNLQNCKSDICTTCICLKGDVDFMVTCHKIQLRDPDELFFNIALNEQEKWNHLVLSENNITHIPENSLSALRFLKILDLSENLISEVDVNEFTNLNDLEDLNLSNNQLNVFDNTLLTVIGSLTKLRLSYNKINNLIPTPRNFTTKLTFLNLSHNNITVLNYNAFQSLRYLEYLDLSFNSINVIHESSLHHLYNLRILYLNNNQITSLASIILPTTLTELYCGFNKIENLPNTTNQIRTLHVDYNSLHEIQNNCTFLKQVEYLNITGNLLVDFPNTKLQNLKVLHISNNNLPLIPTSLSSNNFPILSVLNIDGNPIKRMHFYSDLKLYLLEARNINAFNAIGKDSFTKLGIYEKGCMNLTISGNTRLRFIHEDAFKHLNICFLDISNNDIAYISPRLLNFKNNATIKYGLNAQGNPFHCNCSLQWMLSDLVPQLYSIDTNLLDNLRCTTPSVLAHMRMVHWYKWQEEVFCSDMTKYSAKMTIEIAGVSSSEVILFETSNGLLIVIGVTITLLSILIVVGILLTRKIAHKRRRFNRRF